MTATAAASIITATASAIAHAVSAVAVSSATATGHQPRHASPTAAGHLFPSPLVLSHHHFRRSMGVHMCYSRMGPDDAPWCICPYEICAFSFIHFIIH